MFCPKCGKELPDTARFCGNCGNKLKKRGNAKRISIKSKKLIIAVLGCCICLLILVCIDSFHILHDWQEATCTEPKTCSVCGKTEGEALGHIWEEATCTEPKTCKKCGETKGESLGGHNWEEATCAHPLTCSKCGETIGVALKHWWEKDTCTEPKTCKTCGKRTGRELGHDCADATCMELKTCNRCHVDVCLGRHRMNNDTGLCEICGKELRIALDTSNWQKYLVTAASYGSFGTYIERSGARSLGWEDPVAYYHFENAVIEADCEVIRGRGIGLYGETYSIRDTQRVRVELDRDGNGDFAEKIPDEEMTGKRDIKRVSGFVIIDEDEYEKRGIKEDKNRDKDG